jgi:MtrB/PioB family decaheme-associated outer membrane protein
MTHTVRHPGFRLSAAALAVFGAFSPALFAQEVSELEGSVSVGAAVLSGNPSERALFGQYNGLRNQDGVGLLDFVYDRRPKDQPSIYLRGSNLGLQTRELEAVWQRQGDWRVSADYGELIRFEPYTVNTGLIGFGSTTPQVSTLPSPGTGSDQELSTKRTGLGLSFAKVLSPDFAFAASVRSEKKEGSRIFGAGFACPSSTAPGCNFPTPIAAAGWVLLLPEPIDSNHSQFDARLNYAAGALRLSGGYYGSIYSNNYSTLTPVGGQAIALAPDNQAHQFDVNGLYAFTPTTRANFKLAYTRATQDQSFGGSGLGPAPAGISSLEGKTSTTLAQVGVTSRPMPKLSLLADFRYEDREDKTPIAPYSNEVVLQSTNRTIPLERMRGRLQGSYQFTREYLGTVGLDYESIDRGSFTSTSSARGVSALRQQTDEVGYRLELRRRMSETFSGAISYVSSKRDGSNWLRPNGTTGVTEISDTGSGFTSNAIFMPSLADRKRDKIRLVANWQPTEQWSLQFTAEDGNDKYQLPTDYGLRSSGMSNYTVDATYAVSEQWSLNGWITYGKQALNQARPEGYIMAFDNKSTALGLGVTGKPSDRIQLGGSLSYVDDKNVYAQSLDASAPPSSVQLLNATGGLPDITYRRTEVRVYGRYALSEVSAVRMDLLYFNAKYNDWAYGYAGTPYVFTDGTTVSQDQKQSVTYLGVTYVHTLK